MINAFQNERRCEQTFWTQERKDGFQQCQKDQNKYLLFIFLFFWGGRGESPKLMLFPANENCTIEIAQTRHILLVVM